MRTHKFYIESLETRRLMAADLGLQVDASTPSPTDVIEVAEPFVGTWHNANLAEDVNNDGVVSTPDLAMLAGYLSRNGVGKLSEPNPNHSMFVDAHADGNFTPRDIAIVVARVIKGDPIVVQPIVGLPAVQATDAVFAAEGEADGELVKKKEDPQDKPVRKDPVDPVVVIKKPRNFIDEPGGTKKGERPGDDNLLVAEPGGGLLK